jgi:hypothetical protein
MLCPLVRWQLDGALDGAPLGRMAAAHLVRCERCQVHAAGLETLRGRLVAGAHAAVPPASVHALARRPVERRAVLVLAAVGDAAVIALFARPTDEPAPAGDRAAATASGEPDAIAAEPDPGSPEVAPVDRAAAPAARRGALVAQLGVLFREPQPLRAELDALAADGRRGALTILHIGGVGGLADRIP